MAQLEEKALAVAGAAGIVRLGEVGTPAGWRGWCRRCRRLLADSLKTQSPWRLFQQDFGSWPLLVCSIAPIRVVQHRHGVLLLLLLLEVLEAVHQTAPRVMVWALPCWATFSFLLQRPKPPGVRERRGHKPRR